MPGQNGWATREIPDEYRGYVSPLDVSDMLMAFLEGEISEPELVDWANLILFNDAFDFDGEKIRDVLDYIEESDEPGKSLDFAVIRSFIDRLAGRSS